MRRSNASVEAAIVSDEDRRGFGAFLRAARQQSGRSLEEIARTTKIAIRNLEALERGRVEVLPGGMYRRAILRNYAAAIGLDARVALERLVQTFDSEGSLVLRSEERETGSVKEEAPKTAWLSDRGLIVPTRSFVVVAATFAVVFVAQFVTHLRDTRVGLAAAVASAETQDVDPNAGTSGRPPIEEVRFTPVNPPPTTEPNNEVVVAAESQLVVTSNPAGARVTVNGIAWGVTPITIRYLEPGDKTIRITKDGYLGSERRLRIGEQGGKASVQLTLQPRSYEHKTPPASKD